jgi:uncharacterized protein YegP (UPF0339 family)
MRFEIRRSSSGQFYWLIVGGNNEVMAQSETMVSKASCESAIARVKASAASASVTDKA